MRAARVFIFKATSLPLSPLEAKRIALARSTMRCSVLELSHPTQKNFSFLSGKPDFRTRSTHIDLLLQLLRCQLQVTTRSSDSGKLACDLETIRHPS